MHLRHWRSHVKSLSQFLSSQQHNLLLTISHSIAYILICSPRNIALKKRKKTYLTTQHRNTTNKNKQQKNMSLMAADMSSSLFHHLKSTDIKSKNNPYHIYMKNISLQHLEGNIYIFNTYLLVPAAAIKKCMKRRRF